MSTRVGSRSTVPSRPVLVPGLRVFRRDDRTLQVGLDERRVVLPDTEGVRRLLADLEAGAVAEGRSPEAGLALRDLVDRGLVVERAALAAALSGTASRSAVAAVFAAHGPEAVARLAVRRFCVVEVLAPEPWARRATDWLTGAGVATSTTRRTAPAVTLLVTTGEPVRSRVDRLVRDDRPHLLVALLPARVRVGPFVSPGTTACLRCVDAHLAETDPRRGLVLEQLEGAPPAPLGEPYDPVLAQAGVALAVRDLTAWADGDGPATWSTTIDVGLDLALPRRHWTRHPHCGCSWG